ncbi:MAG: hypothetical protein PGN12_06110 [Sphingomonas phyllosphaerae]
MTLDDLDMTRSCLNVLRGELTVANTADFIDAIADLAGAVAALSRPGLALREFPINGRARVVTAILDDLLVQRGVLELVILDAPSLHGPGGVALHDLNRAIAGITIMLARLKLRAVA